MLLRVPGVITAEQVAVIRARIDAALGRWQRDVRRPVGAGEVQRAATRGLAEAKKSGGEIGSALGTSPLFVAAALPLRVYPPLFNRYGSHGFGKSCRQCDAWHPSRDFASGPTFRRRCSWRSERYDGGELVVEERTACIR